MEGASSSANQRAVSRAHAIRQAFWDATGPLWSKSALAGKMCGVFVSTGTQGGGQEVTIANTLSTFVHHGMIYVPLGYKYTFSQLSDLTEIHGGTLTRPVLPTCLSARPRVAVGCWHLCGHRRLPPALATRIRHRVAPRQGFLGGRCQVPRCRQVASSLSVCSVLSGVNAGCAVRMACVC